MRPPNERAGNSAGPGLVDADNDRRLLWRGAGSAAGWIYAPAQSDSLDHLGYRGRSGQLRDKLRRIFPVRIGSALSAGNDGGSDGRSALPQPTIRRAKCDPHGSRFAGGFVGKYLPGLFLCQGNGSAIIAVALARATIGD